MTPTTDNLGNRTVRQLLILPCIAIGLFLLGALLVPGQWLRPGSALLQTSAALGSVLLLVPFCFSIHKRGGHATRPRRWFVLHVIASLIGTCLVVPHALAGLQGPPLILLLALFILVATGVIARIRIARWMADTPGSRLAPFAATSPQLKDQLRSLIEEKERVLQQLEPEACEALFSVTLQHWLRSPRLAWRYSRIAQRENSLIGMRGHLPVQQSWWRPLHIMAAWLFLLGLVVHVIVVIFFAGYVAEGEAIYWWHLADW
ncbi:MAG: hypothetical protein KTR33_16905 [Gammaproteobacteria bacterium]|nr:hypothetical protein [Gammaproteobacteria bacterium]